MLKTKVAKEWFKKLLGYQEILKERYEKRKSSNSNMNWVCTVLLGSLVDKRNCLPIRRLEDKVTHVYEQIHELIAAFDKLNQTNERPTKIATMVQRYNHFSNQREKNDDKGSRQLSPGNSECLRLRQRERQTLELDEVNRWTSLLQRL